MEVYIDGLSYRVVADNYTAFMLTTYFMLARFWIEYRVAAKTASVEVWIGYLIVSRI